MPGQAPAGEANCGSLSHPPRSATPSAAYSGPPDPAPAPAGDSPLDTALPAVHGSEPGQPPLDRLARAALQSALQQRQARQADESADPRISSLPVCRATRGGPSKPAPGRQASKAPGHPSPQNRTLGAPN